MKKKRATVLVLAATGVAMAAATALAGTAPQGDGVTGTRHVPVAGMSGHEPATRLYSASQGETGIWASGHEAPMQMAQANDPGFRVNQLEEEVRQLTGKVEDMTFQLLQMQEQLRKMQEDNEFRFQELEEKRGSLKSRSPEIAATGDQGLGKSGPSDAASSGNGAEAADGTSRRATIAEVIEQQGALGQQPTGTPPLNLGTITFDANGNIVDSNIGKPIDLTRPGVTSSEVLPSGENELFDLGYQYVQAGEYERAAASFEAIERDHPGFSRMPEAKFWLGESYFSLGRYEEAARVFLENHKQYPNAPLAAQNLLKLGVSLAGLNQRELACATYAEVGKKYPDTPKSVRDRVAIEQQAAKCKSG